MADRSRKAARSNPARAPFNHEQERIADWLRRVRFKRVMIGGVSEADVWKKIQELNAMYEAALSAERTRYDTLLAECTPGQRTEYAAGDGHVSPYVSHIEDRRNRLTGMGDGKEMNGADEFWDDDDGLE